MIKPYPLVWPAGRKRTQSPAKARFSTNMANAVKNVLRELALMGAENVVINSNSPVRNDGQPYANASKFNVSDFGVAVYFTYNGQPKVLPCDAWNTWQDNLQAISKTANSIRMMPQWGVSSILETTISGLEALPETTELNPYEVLNIAKTSTPDQIKQAWRDMIKKYHPDNPETGNRDRFDQVQKAYDELNKGN